MVAKTAKLSMALQGVSRLKIADSKGVRPSAITGCLKFLHYSSSARPHPYDQSYIGALTDYSSGVEATDEFTRATESLSNHMFYRKSLGNPRHSVT